MKRIAVTLVNWNDGGGTLACLDALFASEGVEPRVLVVDNGSLGDDAVRLSADARIDRVIGLSENRGYAGGMNAGLRAWRATGTTDPILILTPDVRLDPAALASMAEALDASPRAGVVGPVIVYREAPRRMIGAGGRIEPERVRAPMLRTFEREDRPYEVDWIDGGCMLFRAEALAEVDGFDERYFAYFEEMDLCLRLKRAGWPVLLAPGAVAHHPKEETVRPSYRYYFMVRNRFLFWRKNFGIGFPRVALRVGTGVVRAFATWVESLVRPRMWHECPERFRRLSLHLRGTVAGVRDHVRGRYGPMPGLRATPDSNVRSAPDRVS